MSGDIDSAFVEIAAGAPEIALAAQRLVPLYEDVALEQAPEPPRSSRLRKVVWRVFVTAVVSLMLASGCLLLLLAAWLGQRGMLPAPPVTAQTRRTTT